MHVRSGASSRWLVVLVLGALLGGFVAGTYVVISQRLVRGSADLVPRWKGAELFWREGTSPYDDRVALESQNLIYGRPARPGEDEVRFAYPFYMIYIIAPLVPFEFHTAAAVFMELMLLGLLLALALLLDALRWLPPPPVTGLLVLFTVTDYFAIRGLLLGQPALIAYIAHMGALWAILRQRDGLAGVLLAVSTVKPQTSFLIVPLLLIWALRARRWRIAAGFAVAFGLLVGASFLAQPGWLFDWVDEVTAYAGYTGSYPGPALRAIMRAFDVVPQAAQDAAYWLLAAGSIVGLLVFWQRRLLRDGEQEFLWGYALTMLVTVFVTPRTATTAYIEVYGVLYVSALILVQRGQQIAVYLGGLALLPGSWLLHLLTVPPPDQGGAGIETPVVYAIFPLLILGLLLWLRGEWPRLVVTQPPLPATGSAQPRSTVRG